MERRSWQCPFCRHHAMLSKGDESRDEAAIELYDDIELNLSYSFSAIACPNAACRKLTADIEINDNSFDYHRAQLRKQQKQSTLPNDTCPLGTKFFRKSLLPESRAKEYPTYIPEEIRNDYSEAYKIKNLSPKASATMCRRCLENIIKDFWNIDGKMNLYNRIKKLEDPEYNIGDDLIQRFHDLKNIGNIGAHMRDDSSYINNDVDSGEAETMLKFIEIVINLTYMVRRSKEKNMQNLKEIAEEKNRKESS